MSDKKKSDTSNKGKVNIEITDDMRAEIKEAFHMFDAENTGNCRNQSTGSLLR